MSLIFVYLRMEKSKKGRIYSRVKRWRGNQFARKKDIHKPEPDSPKVASSPDNNLEDNVVKLPELREDTTSPVENSQTPEGQSHILNWFLGMGDSRMW